MNSKEVIASERVEQARKLFQEFHALCFWCWPAEIEITEETIPHIVRGLRTHGGASGISSRRGIMPIGEFESALVKTLALNRSAESFVAGATVLHQKPNSPRWSLDVDLFHDSPEALEKSVAVDMAALDQAGYSVEKELGTGTLVRVVVARGGGQSKIDWVVDSPFRFFPPERDEELGWKLNFWDAATNKVLALFSRHEFRDYFDLLDLHENYLHLGALIWAAAAKDPGLTPEFILDWLKRSTRYSEEEAAQIRVREVPNLKQLKKTFLKACAETEELLPKLPAGEMGCLYLNAALQPTLPKPDEAEFRSLRRHFAKMNGSAP